MVIGRLNLNKLYQELVISNIQKALKDYEAAENYNHPGLKGRAREIFVTNLLKPFLNPTFGICTGIVIDSNNNQSKQIDIIIYDKNVLPPSMLNDNEGIIPIESVLATIEVKTNLDSEELSNSIENARSIKFLKPKFKRTNIKNSPVYCIFAFKSNLTEKSEKKDLRN